MERSKGCSRLVLDNKLYVSLYKKQNTAVSLRQFLNTGVRLHHIRACLYLSEENGSGEHGCCLNNSANTKDVNGRIDGEVTQASLTSIGLMALEQSY